MLIQQMNNSATSITCFLQLTVLQTDWNCSTRVCYTALQHNVHGVRLALYISTQSSASNVHLRPPGDTNEMDAELGYFFKT
jgi:hypothetical protein